MNVPNARPADEPEIITCWCGASGTYEELFDDQFLDRTCGGGGWLDCYCGGDLCCCHHHGGVECDGCPDCDSDEDLGLDDDFDPDS